MTLSLTVALDTVLQHVQTALCDAKAKGSVPFDAATLDPDGDGSGAAVVALLGQLGMPTGTWPTLTTGATVNQVDGEDALLVKGPAAAPILGIDAAAVTARFTTVASSNPKFKNGRELQVEMEITAGTSWKFSTSFAQLGSTQLGQMTLDNAKTAPKFTLRSVDGKADAYGPIERAGLNLSVGVTMDGKGPFGYLGYVLAALEGTVTMSGPVAIGPNGEQAELRAPSGIPNVGFPVSGLSAIGLTSSVVVVSATATQGQGIWTSGVELEVWALVSVGGNAIPFGIGIPVSAGAWRLFVVPNQGVRLFQLLGFIPGLSLLQGIPDQVQNVVNVDVDVFSLTLGGGSTKGSGWSLQSLQVMVSSPQPWTIVPQVVEIEKVSLNLTVSWSGPRAPAVVTGVVNGTIGLDPVDGKPAVEIAVTVPIPLTAGPITITSAPHVQLPGLGALTTLIGGAQLTQQLPSGVEKVGSFQLDWFSVSIDAAARRVTDAAISLTAASWPFVPGRLELDDLFIDLDVKPQSKTGAVSGQIGGTLVIGDAAVHAVVARDPSEPDWQLAVTAANVVLPSLADLATLAGTDLRTMLPAEIADHHFEIVTLELDADLSKGQMELFDVMVQSEGNWPIVPHQFEIEQLMAQLTLDWRSGPMVSSGELRAVLDFGDLVYLELDAKRETTGDWVLKGDLEQPVSVSALIGLALGKDYSTGPASGISIDVLALTYWTKDGSYDFQVGASWKPQLASMTLELDAGMELASKPDPDKEGQRLLSGHIEGDMKSHFGSNQLELGIVYQFQPNENSFVFKLGFNKLTLTATYAKLANGDETITARLTGISFGEVVEWLVNLVDPSLHFELSAPWDVLNKIHFDDFAIVGNLTKRTIGVEYDPHLDLGIVDVKSITLTYMHKGGSSTVGIAIVGSFVGQDYPKEKPLSWDLLNDPPPAAPGAGAAALDIQDLGVGQHLVLANEPKTMSQVMSDVHSVIVNAEGKHPWDALKFDPSAGWLVAANFTVMGTVTLKLIFDDPVLYGVEISLAGDKAGPFKGLDFEILYRKISDDVGVYHIELKLPDVMRHLEFGEVSITLPVVVVDIYTDGGFYLDFGFPYNNDWSVCFGVQVFPFVGAGGFYIGRLTAADGATDLVPAITNGTFGPVIEFGVALALGVGKTIDEGPLSAGVSVTVQGILQGVVAWFNPTDKSQPSDRYYKIDGSLAIVGKLYGEVDFKVISISISLVASVTASVEIVAYGPIVLGLSVDVEVEASIKILFIRIHFSFSMHLDASFTIGSQQPTPWTLAPGGGSAPSQAPSVHAMRRVEGAHHLLAGPLHVLALTASTPDPIVWNPVNVVGTTEVLAVTMLPVFTVAPDVNGNEAVTVTMVPSMDAPPPGTTTSTSTSFDQLVEALVKWGVQSLTGSDSGQATAVDLQQIYEDLASDWVATGGFAYDNVAAFVGANFAVAVAAPPPNTDEAPAAVLPMLPPLAMTPDGQSEVDFWSANPVSQKWQDGVQSLFKQMSVNYDYSRAPDPLPDTVAAALGSVAALPAAADGNGDEPLAKALFADWALMVARGAMQAARNQLTRGTVAATSGDSMVVLAWLAATGARPAAPPAPKQPVLYHPRTGDSAASIARLFGVTVSELVAANPGFSWTNLQPDKPVQVPAPMALAGYVTVPGDTLDGMAGAWRTDDASIEAANPGIDFSTLAAGTPVAIPVPAALFEMAAANLSAPLAAGSLPISGLTYRVKPQDTFAKVVAAYGQPGTAAGALGEANGNARGVLLAGASVPLELAAASGTIPYTIAAGDSLALVAAFAYARNLGTLPAAYQADQSWFANAIAQANPGIDFSKALDAGVTLKFPTGEETPSGPSPTVDTTTYLTKQNDTLQFVAGYFTMVQLHPADPDLTALETAIGNLNPGVDWTKVGAPIQLPAQQHAIVAGDTLADLAGRFGVAVADVATLNAGNSVLAPNATLTLPPGLAYPVTAGTKLAELASTLGLSVDELVGRIGALPGALAAGTVALPNRRQMDVGDLTGAIAGAGTANVAGMASHFMLHGLRVPIPPDADNTKNEALYQLSGQQFPAPSRPVQGEYSIGFAVGDGSTWVYPVAPYTTTATDTLASLEQTYGSAVALLNPGVDWGNLKQGTVIRVPEAKVAVQFDDTTLGNESPSTTMTVTASASAVPLVDDQPVRHSVAAPVQWTAAAPPEPPLTPQPAGPPPPPPPPPRPTGGSLSLWRLPASLVTQVAADPTAHPYTLMVSPKGRPVGDAPPQASYYAWATWLPITIRRVASPDGGWLDGTYSVIGADQVDRDTLLGLWTALGSGQAVSLSLAYAAAGSGDGLVSDVLDPVATAVIKSNLSTETHSGAQAFEELQGDPAATAAYAELAAPTQFLQLLWEASIVGTGGFYLTYAKASGGGLPSSVWASGSDAQVYVLAITDAALAAAPDRTLYPFTTGAVVADNLDATKVDVFAEAADGSDLTAVASAPPGNVAFQLTRPNASPPAAPTAGQRTESLFSLLGWSLSGNGFDPSPLALPLGPTIPPGSDQWTYDQTVPVYTLAQTRPADMAPGLPPGKDDPYAGIAAGAAVSFGLGYRDVFGNEIATSVPAVNGIQVGYYDSVRQLTAWPSVSATYAIDSPSGTPALELRVALGLDKYVPGPSNLFAVAVRTAAAHRTIYGQVHYQVQQSDVQFSAATSLDAPGTTLLTGAALEAPLRGLAMASYLYLATAQAVQPYEHTVGASELVSAVATAYTLTPAQLFAANAAIDASQIAAGDLTIALLHLFQRSDTLDAIAAAAGLTTEALLSLGPNPNLPLASGVALVTQAWRYKAQATDTLTTVALLEATTPAGIAIANENIQGILSTTATVGFGGKSYPIGANDTFGTLAKQIGTSVAALAAANAGVALFVQDAELFVAATPIPAGTTGGARPYTTESGDTLRSIAKANACTVAGLGLGNGQAVILATGKSVELSGTTVPIRDGTLATVAADLTAKDTPASVADVATAIADPATAADNVLLPGVTLAIPDYVVQSGDTIATIEKAWGSVFPIAQLALLNGPLESGVYPDGTPLLVGTKTVTPVAGETLAQFAAGQGVTIEQLGAANAGTTLRQGQQLAIPGAITLGGTADAAYQVPFAGGGARLIDVANAFDTDAGTIGGLNATMPNLVASGHTVTYTQTGKSTPTASGDTLAAVAARVGAASAEALAADPAVNGLTGLVAPGALLQGPLANVNGRSLSGLAQALGVDMTDLATANSALIGLVAPSQTLVVKHKVDPEHTVTATIGTTADDTIASLVRKLQLQVPAMDLADLLAAYGDSTALLANVTVIVPPPRVHVSSPLANPQVGSPFTQLEVTITIARDAGLVDAAAKDGGMTDAVYATSTLAPDVQDYGGFAGFAKAFETALAPLCLKLASGPDPGDSQGKLWVVDFGAAGFDQVAVDGTTPRFYALAPAGQELESGPASVSLYDPATGTLQPPVTQTFTSVDLDAWMRTALEAIDLFLSPAVAVPAFRLNRSQLTAVVAAKGAIAAALRDRVNEILVDPNPSDDGLAAAREALYQSMLVSLETAYTTDAIVQFPVAVQSPYGPTYTTGASDGFATVASAYGVSVEAAQAEFASIAPGGTFPADTTLDQSAMLRTTGSGETFATLAEFFATDAATVGIAAQDVAGLVPQGTTVGSYTVGANQKLRDIATGAGMSVAAVATQLATAKTVLTPALPVHCFSGLDPIAPRLFAKALVERYQAAQGNTAQDLLTWFGVSSAALGEAVANMRAILCPGAVVENTANRSQHTILASDTFASLLGPLGAPDVGTLLPLLELVSGDGLLEPGVSLALGRVQRTPTATDSFATLATYFGDDPASVAVANQDTGSAFVPGTVFTLTTEATYTVQGPESIAKVASGLGTTPAGFATDLDVFQRAGIFNTSTVMRGLQPLPDFSLSSGKVPLIAGEQYASFLFGTSADASFRSLFMNLQCTVDEIEFEVRDVPAAPGYQESEWLKLGVTLGAPPLQDEVQLDPGQVDVPIPLRAYPQLPLMETLDAAATWPTPTTIDDAKQWDLVATVQHQSAAQDEMLLEATFNAGTTVSLLAEVPDTGLYAKLAQLAIAWPAMQHDVAALAAMAPGAPDPKDRLKNMVGAFATLATELGTALTGGMELEVDEGGGGEAQTYTFLLDPTYDFSGKYLETVDLVLQQGSTTDDVPWPAIFVSWLGSDGKTEERRLTDPAGQGTGSRRYYYPTATVPAFETLTHRFVLPETAQPALLGATPKGRDAVRWQSGQVRAAVRRNADLVGTAETAPEFVYQTPWIAFANAAVPLLQSAAPIALTDGSGFQDRLSAGLKELLTSAGKPLSGCYNIRLLCRYALELATPSGGGAGPPIVELLPVFYVPLWKLSLATDSGCPGGDLQTFASTAAGRVTNWLGQQGLTPAAGDYYLLDLSLFASGDSQMVRPLVELSGLTIAAT